MFTAHPLQLEASEDLGGLRRCTCQLHYCSIPCYFSSENKSHQSNIILIRVIRGKMTLQTQMRIVKCVVICVFDMFIFEFPHFGKMSSDEICGASGGPSEALTHTGFPLWKEGGGEHAQHAPTHMQHCTGWQLTSARGNCDFPVEK